MCMKQFTVVIAYFCFHPSLLENNPSPTMSEVEAIFDGNICRCTGYRPIFDAFKAFASDAPPEMKQKV